MNLLCAAGIGAVSGLRAFTGPASVKHGAVLKALAAGELIADKLPFMPNRTDPPSLAFRAASGAFCGYVVCAKKSPGARWAGILVGAAAAVAASYAGLEYRRRIKLPPVLAAVIEDAVAVGIGQAVVSASGL